MERFNRKLIIGLVILACLTPVGIYLPKLFHTDGAWGEWSVETVKEKTGFVPSGMQKDAETWKAPIADYGNKDEYQTTTSKTVKYILSGFAGVAIISLATFVLLKAIRKNG